MCFIIIITIFASLILQIVNKLYDEDFQKFHDYETTAGVCLLLIRFVYGCFYVYCFTKTIDKMRKRSQRGMQFMEKLMIAGGLWFFSFPFIYFVASFFAHYLRHFVVSAGVLLVS